MSIRNLLILACLALPCAGFIIHTTTMAKDPSPTADKQTTHDCAEHGSACGLSSHADLSKREYRVVRTDEEWRKRLNGMQYRVARQQGTEPPFRNEYWDHKESGLYVCVGCGAPAYSSEDKFRSGTGWPSYTRPYDEKWVATETDRSHGMVRVEVHCAVCGSHQGHVFPDGPKPTGQRFCINSASLEFKPAADAAAIDAIAQTWKPE